MAIPKDQADLQGQKQEALNGFKEKIELGQKPDGFVGPLPPADLPIHELEQSLVKSASDITELQFLALNVFFPERKAADEFPLIQHYRGIEEDARFYLHHLCPLQAYICMLGKGTWEIQRWMPAFCPKDDMRPFLSVYNGHIMLAKQCDNLFNVPGEEVGGPNLALGDFWNSVATNIPDMAEPACI